MVVVCVVADEGVEVKLNRKGEKQGLTSIPVDDAVPGKWRRSSQVLVINGEFTEDVVGELFTANRGVVPEDDTAK